MVENVISYLDTAIFDFALLKKQYGEITAIDVVALFLKDLPEALEKIEVAYTTNNWSELERLVHKFRGCVCYCCVAQLTEACANLQLCLRENKNEQIESRYADFITQILLAEKEMHEALENL